MYRTKAVTIIIVLVAFSSCLNAAGTNKVELYLNGALAFPLAPEGFSDYWKIGFLNFGGGIGYNIIPAISANVYFDWCNFGFDGEKLAHEWGLGGVVSFSGYGASVMTITANVKASVPSGKVRPYFWGGAGLFILSVGDGSMSGGGSVYPLEGDSENALGINFGAGLDFAVAKTVDLFVDGRFVLGFTEGESTSLLPVRLGVKVKV